MRVILVDDSRLARLELKEQLLAIGKIDVVAEAANIQEAEAAVIEHKPDLLLLDINMPGGDGFQLLEQLSVVPQVIFVTAYDEFALKSFEYNALDYLMKPVTLPRLQAALAKYKVPSENKMEKDSRFFIKDGKRCFFVIVKDVIAFEAMGNYSRVHLTDAIPSVYRSLSQLELRLPADVFFRAARGWIINVEHITEVQPDAGGGLVVTLTNKLQVEVSRRQASQFKQIWGL